MTAAYDRSTGPVEHTRHGPPEPGRTPTDGGRATDAATVDAGRAARSSDQRLTGTGIRRLQRLAGNRAVAQLVTQRRATPAGATTGAAAPPGHAAPVTGSATTTAVPATAETPSATRAAPGAAPTQAPAAPADDGSPGRDGTAGQRTSVGGGRPGGDARRRGVVVQRKSAGAGQAGGGPGGGGRRSPQSDPKFVRLKADVRAKQKRVAAHPPPRAEAANAQGAAKPPADDKVAQGKAANAEKMNAAKPGEFDKAGFIRAVNEAIAAQAPKNLDEADSFGDSGKADAVKGAVQGKVTAGKESSAKAIETTTKAPPDTSAAKDKKVEPLKTDKAPPAPAPPNPTDAVPDKAPAEATDFSAGPAQVDQQMAEAEVTEETLAKSNEPEFTGALKQKKEGEKHAATAPAQVRAAEAKTLQGARAEAATAGASAMTALAADRKQAGQSVTEGKEGAKDADETKRAQVTSRLQKVFDATKSEVEAILSGLDGKVDAAFSSGEKKARDAFTAEHKRRMDEYKDKRYSGLLGKGRWLKDKFAGLPKEADQIFVEARKGYVARMQEVISAVADVIGTELNRAKKRIAQGRDELQAEVRKLPADLQAIGKEAAGEFSSRFDDLTESVDAKGSELVQTLASKYNDALKAVDEEIAAEKEKNKGLVAKAVDAVKGVIDTILKLKDMLLGVLAKAASAVVAIIKDPIGFLGKLVSAVGAGLKAFLANIGEHLKKGLLGWLLGAMAAAGVTLPDKFDLKGLIVMIGSMLGLTWAAIRGRVVRKGVPEPAMGAVEQSVPAAQKLQSEGIGGIWEDIKAKVGDLKESLFSKISEYLIPTVLVAGITWIVSLLNPASAFIKACKMIIDIVTFIVTQGAQIIEFVNAVLDAVIAIAGGGAGGVPGLIEQALSKSIPVLIGALAAILGIGGIAGKVQKFFKALAKPVGKAVDFVVDKIAAIGKKLWAKLKSRFARKKGEDRKPEDLSPKEKEKIARKAADDGIRALRGVPIGQASGALDGVYAKWQPKGLKGLESVPVGDHKVSVRASVNPTATSKSTAAIDIDPEKLSIEQVTATSFASSETAASGSLDADTARAITRIMKSGASKKDLQVSDSQEGAHAEEQVVNHFDVAWEAHNAAIASALPAGATPPDKWFSRADMRVNVSKTSCINCATHIVRFKRSLEGKSSSVSVSLKFASLYQGRQEVPESVMQESGDFVKLFVDHGRLVATSRLGRLWGRLSATGGKKEPVTEVPGTHGAGKAGLAILRSAGISIESMSESDVEGAGDAEQKRRLALRKSRLEKALADVDEKLKIKKG